MISRRVIRFVQQELKSLKYRIGEPDGKLGPKTESGLRKALDKRKGELPEGWVSWPRTRLITAYVQLRCRDENVNPGRIDGFGAARPTTPSMLFVNAYRIIWLHRISATPRTSIKTAVTCGHARKKRT